MTQRPGYGHGNPQMQSTQKVQAAKNLQYSKGNFTKMKEETKVFSRDRGNQGNRSVEENWTMLKTFLEQSIE